jgi:N utilization substance protein B
MINRRHLRIKVLQILYAYFQSNEENYKKAENELMTSVDNIYDLYLYLLLIFNELKAISDTKIHDGKTKIRPSSEDLTPNTRFIDNKLFLLLENNRSLRNASETNLVNWIGDEHHEMFKKIMLQIRESEIYFSYMNTPSSSFTEDKEFACSIFKTEIANSPFLHHFFEEKSIHWMDDIDLACAMVIKTLKSFEEDTEDEIKIMPLYRDPEDETEFVKALFRKTISMNGENEELIEELTKNWDIDRIAKMDIILMKMAITELQIFNNIPKKVTLNEYIEISKFYSTPKSSGFINGILDKAIDILEKDNKIIKIGRGLLD